MFTFDTIDRAPCPGLHFQASPICLMIQAQPHLCSSARLRTDRADAAQSDVNRLLELYRRRPRAGCNSPVIVPVGYHPASAMQPYNNSHPSAPVLPTISSSPPPSHPTASAPISFGFGRHLEMPGLTPSSSASTVASEDAETDPDLVDPQLIEYTQERAVTWEELKTRPPLFPGEDGGTWQFSTAEEVIRSWH